MVSPVLHHCCDTILYFVLSSIKSGIPLRHKTSSTKIRTTKYKDTKIQRHRDTEVRTHKCTNTQNTADCVSPGSFRDEAVDGRLKERGANERQKKDKKRQYGDDGNRQRLQRETQKDTRWPKMEPIWPMHGGRISKILRCRDRPAVYVCLFLFVRTVSLLFVLLSYAFASFGPASLCFGHFVPFHLRVLSRTMVYSQRVPPDLAILFIFLCPTSFFLLSFFFLLFFVKLCGVRRQAPSYLMAVVIDPLQQTTDALPAVSLTSTTSKQAANGERLRNKRRWK